MEDLINTLLPFVPEAYRAKVAVLIALSPYITRSLYALMNGRGLKGVLASIWFGTNTPKANAPLTTDNGPQPTAQPPTNP